MFRTRPAGWLLALVVLVAAAGYIRALRPVSVPAEVASVPRAQLDQREGLFHLHDVPEPFSGWLIDIYEDGSVKLRTAVVAGQLHGVSEGWHTNGVMELRETFDHGVPHGTRTTWHPNGTRRSEGRLVAGHQQGTFRQWYDNGALAAEVEFNDGKPQGISQAWYPSGCLKAEALMQRGTVQVRHYYSDGERREPTLLAGAANP